MKTYYVKCSNGDYYREYVQIPGTRCFDWVTCSFDSFEDALEAACGLTKGGLRSWFVTDHITIGYRGIKIA